MNFKQKMKNFIVGFMMFTVLWYLGYFFLDSRAFPNPFEVFRKLPTLVQDEIGLHILASMKRLSSAMAISLVIGVTIGFLMGRYEKINKFLNPLVYFTYPIPKTALLPVVMILFGLGDTSKITLIVLITVFPFIVAIRDAVLNVDKEYYMPLKSLGATDFQMVTHITAHAILPSLLTNLRLSVGTALSILFFAENYGTSYGLGYYIQNAWARIDYIEMYAGILVISFIGFALFIFIDVLEERLCDWKNI